MSERIPHLIDHLTQPQDAELSDYAGSVDLIAQPKLNGVRAVWLPGKQKLFTKNGREITSCPHIVKAIRKARDINQLPLDGELYLHGVPLDSIAGAVRQSAPADLLLSFNVFDYIHTAPQLERCQVLTILEHERIPGVNLVPWVHVKRAKDIKTLYQQWLDAGFEGIILRHGNLWYADGKQHAVARIKPLQDAEFKFIGFAGDHSISVKGARRFTVAIPDYAVSQLAAAGPGAAVTIAFNRLRAGMPDFPRFVRLRAP